MVEKLKVFSDCEICGRNYWLKDLQKVVRQTIGYDYAIKPSAKMKSLIDNSDTYVCKECVGQMDKGEGAQTQLTDGSFLAMRE